MNIATVLGDSRPVTRTYGDGSVDCPWCSNAIITPKTECGNPGCDAFPGWQPDALTARRAKQAEETERIARETATREWSVRYAKERAAEHQAWRDEQIEEASKRGTCLHCLFAPGWERVRFIKHRNGCPKVAR